MDRPTWVVVLGDLGRSPRMQNHALSLLQATAGPVRVVAQLQSLDGVPAALLHAPRVSFSDLPRLPRRLESAPRPLRWLLKALLQAVVLAWVLLRAGPAPRALLVQSPPALPVLAVCAAVAWLRGARLIVDVHNLAYTLMRPSAAPAPKAALHASDSALVRIAAAYEQWATRRAAHALTVSHEFSAWLAEHWGVRATVLHDYAPARFGPVTAAQAHTLLAGTLRADLLRQHHRGADFLASEFAGGRSPLTCTAPNGDASWRDDPRPALLVSSTSWTPDEDFGVLLDAAAAYDRSAAPRCLLIVVTGKGPGKAGYLAALRERRFERVAICTAWLSAEDYPRLLACADLGVSLHASSSDLDLPMKVADMLGCGVPVCGVRYAAAAEQIVEGRSGALFSSAQELAAIWQRLCADSAALQALRGCVTADRLTWEDAWRSACGESGELLLGEGGGGAL